LSDPTNPQFRRAILALAGGSGDERIVRLASEVGRAAHAELVGVHVVEVEWSLPLDADIAARSEEAQQILDQAELEAEQLKMRLEPVLLQAREVGAALVDEATERGADVLILALGYRKRFGGDFAIGRTIPYVLKHAPCAVWVVREPMPEELE
jgi:nucleotide-binding universal stress UspA family protein